MSDKLLCIVAPTEKGFWSADMYLCTFKDWTEYEEPYKWSTSKIGEALDEFLDRKGILGHYDVQRGITGICSECGEHHIDLEEICNSCGGEVDSYEI